MADDPATYYSRDPEEYAEKTQREDMPAVFLEIRDTFLDRVEDGGTILDVGCGPGHDAAYFAEQGYEVTGVDVAPGMIDEAEKRYDAPTFMDADMRDLPLPDASYDGVWCNATVFHLPEQGMQEAVEEMYRVMTPGGMMQIAYKIGEGTITKNKNEGELKQYLVSDADARQMLTTAGFTIDDDLSGVHPVPEVGADGYDGFGNYFVRK